MQDSRVNPPTVVRRDMLKRLESVKSFKEIEISTTVKAWINESERGFGRDGFVRRHAEHFWNLKISEENLIPWKPVLVQSQLYSLRANKKATLLYPHFELRCSAGEPLVWPSLVKPRDDFLPSTKLFNPRLVLITRSNSF